MKKLLAVGTALATVAIAYTLGRAQETSTPYADTNAIFGQLDADRNGTVPQQVMHAPAGDVLAVYIGKAPRQMYTKQDELIYVISGQGTANVGYPSYTLKPGSLLSIPRKTAFQITSTGSIPIKALVIASPNNDANDRQVLQP